jgi:geranylgeranyl reductase family protein
MMKEYDVVIIGAGPAGCACALALRNSGLKVAILDKQDFPRDKVCGDAIPGRAVKTLKQISPEFAEAFKNFPKKYLTKKTSVSYKGRVMNFYWKNEAYTCARMDFDNFLFSMVKQNTGFDVYTNTHIDDVTANENSITITAKNKTIAFNAKMLIGADGAHSIPAKQLANRLMDRNHHVGSVRAYYSNISNTDNNTTEIYFDKKFMLSYLWVFPLPGNTANVGFGMLSSEIVKKKINLKKTFYQFIEETPGLTERFKNARQTGDLEGFGLPLGSRTVTVSGNNFLLAGDAASLIDPVSGDGIGNAMLSGKLAAEQVIKSFKANNFSAAFMQQYDKSLAGMLGKELKWRFKVQRIFSKIPFLLDLVFWVGQNKTVQKIMNKVL